jgi:hypothetical protein
MSAKSSPPQPAATPLQFDLPPLPPERVACPAPFAAEWVEMTLDVPQKEIAAAGTNTKMLARVLTAWSLTAGGQPVPITDATLNTLADQMPPLFMWLLDEWTRRRFSPLAARPTPPTGSS